MTGQEVALREAVDGTITQLRDPKFEQEIGLALPEGADAKKFLRAAATAALEKPDLATADRRSLIRALLRCAETGLMPNGREAALVVFNTQVSFLPMIEGVRKKLAEYGWTLRTATIYENDEFEDHSDEGYVVHRKPRPGVDRGAVEGAYAMAIHRDGRREAEVYSEAQIQEVRKKAARSQNVWNTWPDQMREKTPAHRLVKKMPFDPKDRERLEQVTGLELEHGAATEMLYGEDSPRDRNRDEAPGAASTTPTPQGQQAGEGDTNAAPSSAASPDEAPIDIVGEEIPWDGNEPEPEPTEQADVPRFPMGKHEGKTVAEVFGLGDDGISYLSWALKNWRTEPMREALAEFAETHPEIA